MIRPVVLVALLPLAACAGWPEGTIAHLGADADANVLAPAIANYVASAVPSGSAVCVKGDPTPMSMLIGANLRRDGVLQNDSGLPVTYQVGPVDADMLLRVTVNGTVGSEAFQRDTFGTLHPTGPLMVMHDGR